MYRNQIAMDGGSRGSYKPVPIRDLSAGIASPIGRSAGQARQAQNLPTRSTSTAPRTASSASGRTTALQPKSLPPTSNYAQSLKKAQSYQSDADSWIHQLSKELSKAPSRPDFSSVDRQVAQLQSQLGQRQTSGPDFSSVHDYVNQLRQQLTPTASGPRLPEEIDLDRFRTEIATIEDIANKYGFDYSRDYAEAQAEALAQAQRDAIQTARERAEHETQSAQTNLEHDFFQQYRQQQQALTDSGLNAGIAAERDLRLDMNRQHALADILANAQLYNQELDRNLSTVEQERIAYADRLYNERLQQAFQNAMAYTDAEQRENLAHLQAALQQRQQLSNEAWREYEFNNMSAAERERLIETARQHGEEMAWREYEFNNLSESERQRLLQNERQHAEEMAWREYEFNNMSAAERARLMADAEKFGMEMAWRMHEFEMGNEIRAGYSGFNQSQGGGGNFTQYRRTSDYGVRKDPFTGKSTGHKGVDFAVPMNTPIGATVGGTVIHSGYTDGGFGTYVAVKDSDGMVHIYAHLNNANVRVGDKISPGQIIGRSGNSGRSTGPHLHYEVRKGSLSGNSINPNRYLG